ncbi:MAG: hypothetical protein ACYCV5_00020 [Acidimicrobiales bacterium]|nr:hypothetical protein [Actinomycetota bacterium]
MADDRGTELAKSVAWTGVVALPMLVAMLVAPSARAERSFIPATAFFISSIMLEAAAYLAHARFARVAKGLSALSIGCVFCAGCCSATYFVLALAG